MRLLLPTLAVAAVALASPATAKTMTFRATLGGAAAPTLTGSPAAGTAIIKVDTASGRVSLDLDVTGITIAQLDDARVAKSGPVEFRVYRGPGDSDLLLAVPFGTNYRATAAGFRVTLRGYDYAAAAKALDSGASLDEFVNALRAQRMLIDVHTDKFPAGEIGGYTMVR